MPDDAFTIMTSSNGNILSFYVFFGLCQNKGWANDRNAGDLRRHRAHYDVTVMTRHW